MSPEQPSKVRTIVLFVIAMVLVVASSFAALFLADDAISVVLDNTGDVPVVVVDIAETAMKFLASAGLAPMVMLVIQLCKALGLLQDGDAGKLDVIGMAVAYLTVIIVQHYTGFDIFDSRSQAIIATIVTALRWAVTVFGAMGSFKGLEALKVITPSWVRDS